jgi:hypothetical protein
MKVFTLYIARPFTATRSRRFPVAQLYMFLMVDALADAAVRVGHRHDPVEQATRIVEHLGRAAK